MWIEKERVRNRGIEASRKRERAGHREMKREYDTKRDWRGKQKESGI